MQRIGAWLSPAIVSTEFRKYTSSFFTFCGTPFTWLWEKKTLFEERANDRATTLSCPVPLGMSELIRLGHGSGGKLTAQLIESVFLPDLGNAVLNQLDDAAVVSAGGTRLAVTTDSYVVNPIFFPGGDIGKLAVH